MSAESADGRDAAPEMDPLESLAAITEERDRLAVEKAEMQDRVLRAQAEFQNYRRRVEKEKQEFHEYAAAEMVKAILPVVDDFERALKVEHANSEYAKGMEMIYQRLFETLKKAGLEPIESLGQPFDPHVHEAVDRKETSQEPEGTVLEDHRRGYMFKGRLLRPAWVKVAVRPAGSTDEA